MPEATIDPRPLIRHLQDHDHAQHHCPPHAIFCRTPSATVGFPDELRGVLITTLCFSALRAELLQIDKGVHARRRDH